MTNADGSEIVLDARRRTSLAKVGRREHRHYLAKAFDDGTIVLTPAVTVSAVELAALADPAIRDVLARAKDTPRSALRERGSFIEHAER
jgi:hypothetical protein